MVSLKCEYFHLHSYMNIERWLGLDQQQGIASALARSIAMLHKFLLRYQNWMLPF